MSTEKQLRILYMEDDEGLARLLQKKMNRQGFSVDIAKDGDKGLAMFEEQAYDILFVDHKMPGCTGLDVIRRLASENRLPPTVMVTGAGDERIAVEAIKLGAGDYIVKDPEGGYLELMSVVVEKILNQKRLVQAKEQAERDLLKAYGNLEKLVLERTEELLKANSLLEEEIYERKRAEKLMRQTQKNLEHLVMERTEELEREKTNLEEMNITLKVLLKNRDEDRKHLEDNLIYNVKHLVLPYVDKLKKYPLSAEQKICVEILESNIHEIVSPYARKLSSEYFMLTPSEIRVANLLKSDKTTKEIANTLKVSESAIVYHRYNIRKKLGLNNKKINLKTYLKTLPES